MADNLNERFKKDDKKYKIAIVLNVLIAFIVLIIICEIIFGAMFKGIYVVQSSMYPTLTGASVDNKYGGDYVYVSPYDTPEYGDIVVVYRGEVTIIKRVVAFGGDRVKIVDGDLFVMYAGDDEFTLVQEDYVHPDHKKNPDKNNFPYYGDIDEGHLVKEGCMFLLGDNRDVSVDSRENGDFALENLYGVVTDWSMKHKGAITAIHKFFKFDVPAFFGKTVPVEGL